MANWQAFGLEKFEGIGGKEVITRNTAGVNNPNAKLTEEQVREIRRLFKEGKTSKELGKQFGISTSAAFMVAKRQRYASIQ